MPNEAPEEKEPETDAPEEEQKAPEKDEPDVVAKDDDGNVTVKPARSRDNSKRRGEAYRELQERVSRFESELARERREKDELRAALTRSSQPREAAPQKDPFDSALSEIWEQQESIQSTLRSGAVKTEAEAETLRRRFYDLEKRKITAIREDVERKIAPRIPQQAHPVHYVMQTEFSDVVGNPAALDWGGAEYRQLRARGWPETIETAREAFRRARTEFQTSVERTTPTPAQQARYGGVAAQAGGKAASPEIRLDANARRMATARWPDLEEEEAYRKMAALMRRNAGKQGGDEAS